MNRELFHEAVDKAKFNLLLSQDVCEDYLWDWGGARSKYISLTKDYNSVGGSILKGKIIDISPCNITNACILIDGL